MHQILNARLADDIAALDIPQEYKVIFTKMLLLFEIPIDLKIKLGASCSAKAVALRLFASSFSILKITSYGNFSSLIRTARFSV